MSENPTPRRVSRRVVRPVGRPGEVRPVEETVVAEQVPHVPGPVLPAAVPAAPARPVAPEAPLVPSRAADDGPVGWHEAEDSNDERLRRDVPPHWGRGA